MALAYVMAAGSKNRISRQTDRKQNPPKLKFSEPDNQKTGYLPGKSIIWPQFSGMA
jgi:hypothetical protein